MLNPRVIMDHAEKYHFEFLSLSDEFVLELLFHTSLSVDFTNFLTPAYLESAKFCRFPTFISRFHLLVIIYNCERITNKKIENDFSVFNTNLLFSISKRRNYIL